MVRAFGQRSEAEHVMASCRGRDKLRAFSQWCFLLASCAPAHEATEPANPTIESAPRSAPTPAPPPPPSTDEPKPQSAQSSPPADSTPLEPSEVCKGRCQGRITAELVSAVRSSGGQARTCYEAALRQNPKLEGKVTVQIRISPGGTACSTQVTTDSLGIRHLPRVSLQSSSRQSSRLLREVASTP